MRNTLGSVVFIAVVISLLAAPFALAEVHEELDAYPYEFDHPEIEHDEPLEPIISASGDVLFLGEGESKDVYVMLGDESERRYELIVGPLEQGIVEIDEPVNWTQTLNVTAEENVTINLWNHNDSIPDSFLSDVTSMEVSLDGEIISEVPLFSVPNGTWELTIAYRTPAVQREVVCEHQTVRDLLPPGAEVISSDLPLDTYVQEVCRIRLFHESHTSYSDVSFQVSEIDQGSIVSIYSVENEEYLYLSNNSLYVPRR